MVDLVYLVGQPGAGKSTLMESLTARCLRLSSTEAGRPGFERFLDPVTYDVCAIELGRRRQNFSGTDALSMSVMPLALDWIATMVTPLVLGEGDRLTSLKFLLAARDAGYVVTVPYCWVPDELAIKRRESRGSTQAQQWVAGRMTKIARVRAALADEGIASPVLDCTQPVRSVTAQLREVVPALEVLP